MKRILSLMLFLVAATLLTNAQTTRKVLFIGNSYIYTNDLPSMVKTLALGKYRANLGMGLVINNDFVLGKAAAIASRGGARSSS